MPYNRVSVSLIAINSRLFKADFWRFSRPLMTRPAAVVTVVSLPLMYNNYIMTTFTQCFRYR